METPLALEDTKEDVITKTLYALKLKKSAVPMEREEYLKFISETLGLDSDALDGLATYFPQVELPEEIRLYAFPYFTTFLNIWTLRCDDGVVIVDAGQRPEHLKIVLQKEELDPVTPPAAVLITHGHHDHVGGLTVCPFCPIISAGTDNMNMTKLVQDFKIASRPWKIFRLPGHSEDSLGFATTIQGRTVFFTGDALFAGSMGNTKNPDAYKENFEILLSALRGMPDDTIILPGHGPATLLGLEWEHNPFLKGKR